MAGRKKTTEKGLGEIFTELDGLLEMLEQEESLEKSFELYKKGVGLIRQANEGLEKIEKQVKVLDEEGILT